MIVLATPLPSSTVPQNSQMAPRIRAVFSLMAPDPTEVAQLLAASFDPMPNDITHIINATQKHSTNS